MLIDSHCHIHDRDYGVSPADTLAHAHAHGVDKMITIGVDLENSLLARDFAAQHAEVFWTLGWHPGVATEANVDLGAQISQQIADFLRQNADIFAPERKLVGIGEIGLDYHYEPYNTHNQCVLLENMLQIAQDHQLPVSFHVREAFDDFWPIFDNFHLVPSVLHSFSDSKKNMRAGLERGMYIGVNGLSTFADIAHAPLERIIFETDAPYLTPEPFRGTINEPAYISAIAKWAANHYQQNLDEVAKITTANVEKIFKI